MGQLSTSDKVGKSSELNVPEPNSTTQSSEKDTLCQERTNKNFNIELKPSETYLQDSFYGKSNIICTSKICVGMLDT